MEDRIAGIIGKVIWALLWMVCALVCLAFLPLGLLTADK